MGTSDGTTWKRAKKKGIEAAQEERNKMNAVAVDVEDDRDTILCGKGLENKSPYDIPTS